MFCFVLSVGGVRGVKLSVWGVCVWCVLLVLSVERVVLCALQGKCLVGCVWLECKVWCWFGGFLFEVFVWCQ